MGRGGRSKGKGDGGDGGKRGGKSRRAVGRFACPNVNIGEELKESLGVSNCCWGGKTKRFSSVGCGVNRRDASRARKPRTDKEDKTKKKRRGCRRIKEPATNPFVRIVTKGERGRGDGG